jgi:hypothetical protein
MQGIFGEFEPDRQKAHVNALMLRGIFAKFPTQSCRELKSRI